MRHIILVEDYNLLYLEGAGYYDGVAKISKDKVNLRAFIADTKLENTLGSRDHRGNTLEVDLKILESYITRVGIKKKMIMELTSKDKLVPEYLFIGEVKKKWNDGDKKGVIFDCGIELDVSTYKFPWVDELNVGDYILVIGFLHMYSPKSREIRIRERKM